MAVLGKGGDILLFIHFYIALFLKLILYFLYL